MNNNVYQLKIQLKGWNPPIWRTIQVRDDITFYKLHGIIQKLMDWCDDHLFEFKISRSVAIGGDPDGGKIEGAKSAKNAKLQEYFTEPKQKIEYLYDFGACWECSITLMKILEQDVSQKYPVCIDGKGSVPDEYGDDDELIPFDIQEINKKLGHKQLVKHT